MVGRIAVGVLHDGADRGQLILIGAIAMALIVIGLVLVVNTALFTQVVGSEGTVETTKDGGVVAEELEDSVSAVVHHENVKPGTDAPTGVDSEVDNSLEPLLLNSTLDSSGAYVSADFDGVSNPGAHLYQDTNTSLDDGSTNPVEIPDVGTSDIGYFRLGVQPGTGNMTVEVDGSPTHSLDVNASNSGEVVLNPSTGGSCTVDTTGDFLWIDVYRGVDYTGQCHFDLFQSVEGPYRVTLRDGYNVAGQYRIVLEEPVGSLDCTVGASSTCDDAVWAYLLDFEYDTSEVSADPPSPYEVNVYE